MTPVHVQVYRGRLHNGEQVAVKVQRPFVLETVTVDLFLVRSDTLSSSGCNSVPCCSPHGGFCCTIVVGRPPVMLVLIQYTPSLAQTQCHLLD